jgi:hypothetical protein
VHFALIDPPVVVQANDALVEVVDAAGYDASVTVGAVVRGRASADDGRAMTEVMAIIASAMARLREVATQDRWIDGAHVRRIAARFMDSRRVWWVCCGVVAGDAKGD